MTATLFGSARKALLTTGFLLFALLTLPLFAATASQPSFGPNVLVFDPSMAQSQIQATVDLIAVQQVSNEFGTQRYALLFKPGTYGSAASPLIFQVGYYTSVAGLGASPADVVINGSIDVYNRCLAPDNCIALDNFWRSLSNLTINVAGGSGCQANTNFWAVSQASPMRRVSLNGNLSLMDYCSAGPQYASGGFIADSEIGTGGTVINGSQQQFLVRNSSLGGWSNGVWNQVFSGVVNAPAQSFPSSPYTTLTASPTTREAPYLYLDSKGKYNVFAPSVQNNSVGASWANAPTPGKSYGINKFFIVTPANSAKQINSALRQGLHLLFTPGVYNVDQTLEVQAPNTVVLGLGFPTLVPTKGNITMRTSDKGMLVSGLIFDAGAKKSSTLFQVGIEAGGNTASNPTTLSDVFFRIGGATPGSATNSLVVNSNNAILDDVWAWRADHGDGVGWTSNQANTGVIVNGKNVTAYGLFVEHYQQYEVIWNANGGTVIFFQNEMPYDPPSQVAWMESPTVNGWAAFKVAKSVSSFKGYGMGSYSFFNQGINIYAANAFEAPATLPAGSFNDLLTLLLNGDGGILNVINDTGGPTTGPGSPTNLVSYP